MKDRVNGVSIAWVFLCMGWLAAYWLVLALESPVLSNLPGWFWSVKSIPVVEWTAVLSTLVVIGVSSLLMHSAASRSYLIVLGIVSGAVVQIMVTQWSGWGWESLTWKLEHTGHHTFVKFALMQHDWFDVISNYNVLVNTSDYSEFLSSKGPGSVLFYQLFIPLAQSWSEWFGVDLATSMHRCLALVWPVIGFLTLIPLTLWLKQYAQHTVVKWTVILLVLNPAMQLISLHLDQVLFPLLAVWSVTWADRAAKRLNLMEAVALGVVGYLALFVNFALVWPFMVAGLWAIKVAVVARAKNSRLLTWLSFITIGFAITAILFVLLFDYHFWHQYQVAIENHHRAKFWEWRSDYVLYYALYNPWEWMTWAGPLSACAIGWRMYYLVRFGSPVSDHIDRFMWLWIFVVLLLCIFGQTKGETARLWLFWVPWYTAIAAHAMVRLARNRQSVVVSIAVVSQVISLCLMRIFQDFG